MKKFLFMFLILLIAVLACLPVSIADAQNTTVGEAYIIFNEQGEFLFERAEVQVGDQYVTSDFIKYEITHLDANTKTGKAKFVKKITPPKVEISSEPSKVTGVKKTISMYSTHNDESYVIGDGYDSIYGHGGILDVAKKLKQEFEKLGVTVTLDETLHIPHDSNAYSRSSVTAKRLLQGSPQALFDIHRDGVSRSVYATKVNGVDRSKIRIVLGLANPYMEANEQLAIYILSVAQKLYPWLFCDIYYASGHYNQNLFEKALLFECGTHLIEKDLVLKSMPELAKVIDTALFSTVVTPDNDLIINGNPTEDSPLVIDKVTETKKQEDNAKAGSVAVVTILIVLGVVSIFAAVYYFYKKYNALKQTTKK